MEEEGSQSPTPRMPAAPTHEEPATPEVVVPSTSAGGRRAQEEPEPRGERLVVYGPQLPKKKCGAYRKKLAKLRKEAEGNLRPPLQQGQMTEEESREVPKRKKGEKDTPPSAHREDKRRRKEGCWRPGGGGSKSPVLGDERTPPKGGGRKAAGSGNPSGAPHKGAIGGVGLTAAQRTNPLTVVATAEGYPEALLSQGDFNRFRVSFRELAKKTPTEQMPRIEASFEKGGVFVFVASDQRSKEWLLNKVATLEFGGPKLRVGGVELIQKLHKATVWLPGPPEEPAEVMRRLGAYNPTLNMNGWRSVKAAPLNKDSGRQDTEERYVLVFQLPESQVRALGALDNRPWMELGRVTFKVSRQAPEGQEVEAMAVDQA